MRDNHSTIRAAITFACVLTLIALTRPAHTAPPPGWPGTDLNGTPCRGRPQGAGPWDYRDPANAGALHIVEINHFTKKIEQLIPDGRITVDGGINYTLTAVPNHHRALWAMIRYHLAGGRRDPDHPPAECFLQRAVEFAPDDVQVRLLFAIYLHKRGLRELAAQRYEEALEMAPKHAEAHYNYGLLLVEMKHYEAAREHAVTAYRLGFPLKGLRNKLAAAGEWPKDALAEHASPSNGTHEQLE